MSGSGVCWSCSRCWLLQLAASFAGSHRPGGRDAPTKHGPHYHRMPHGPTAAGAEASISLACARRFPSNDKTASSQVRLHPSVTEGNCAVGCMISLIPGSVLLPRWVESPKGVREARLGRSKQPAAAAACYASWSGAVARKVHSRRLGAINRRGETRDAGGIL